MGANKKKAKFIAKGHLAHKLKQRNERRKVQSQRERRKNGKGGGHGDRKPKAGAGAMDAEPTSAKRSKGDTDIMDEMDVDDFLNADFLDSDAENDDFADDGDEHSDDDDGTGRSAKSKSKASGDDDDDVMDGESSSEEEDEDALDPRYMSELPSLANDDDDDDDDEGSKQQGDDDDGEADAPGETEEATTAGRTTLSMALLVKTEKEAFGKATAAGLRRMMKIFSDACRSSDAADANKDGEIMYEIQSSTVYNRLMLSVFRKSHVAFARLVGADTDSSGSESPAAKLKVDERKWKKYALLLRRFFGCVCYLLEQTTGQDVQLFVLRELAHYVPFVAPCPKTARRLLKALLKLWAKSLNNSVCMLAFVRIRDLALQLPFPFLELALKGIYITYMRNTKFTNEATLPHHVLLGNCVVELYGLDLASAYQHAFVYIRQLALAIRKTITAPSPETFQGVLNWQFFNQLRVWTAVVCAYPGEAQLRALVYPLAQLLFALVRLSSTVRFAPLRFHCVKLLQQLAFATDAFVPTSPVLLEVLAMPPFSTSYRGKGGAAAGKKEPKGQVELDLDLCVKLAKSHVESKRVHDLVVARLFDLLQRECDVYKFHVGFPEFAVPLLLTLGKFVDACRIPKWAALARGVADSLKKRSDWIRARRSALDAAPKDVALLDAFLKAERDGAVQKAFASDVAELKKKIATTSDGTQQAADAGDSSDSDSDGADDRTQSAAAPVKIGKKKQRKLDAIAGRRKGGSGVGDVDDETFAKVKKMSLHEFKQAVAEVDDEDQVEDFAFSDEDQ
ncbi:hypothetical protein PybrP1_002118 [[Pythium] brassicae (nom. inval.)]|nr:hypothetical protein PybrP1_002118 [[Pythium] brassicae (nom. inval.)]